MSGYASMVEDCRQLVLAKLEDLNGLDKHMVLQEIVKELSEESASLCDWSICWRKI